MQLTKKHRILIYSTIIIAIAIIALLMTGEDPYIKVFFVSPRDKVVIFSNVGVEGTLEFAEDFFNKGETVKALIAYKHAIRLDPDNIDAYTNMAKTYSEIGNYGEAKKYIEKAISTITPNTPAEKAFWAYYGGGIAYFNSASYEGNYANENARKYLSIAIDASNKCEDLDLDRYVSELFYCLGATYINEEQYDKAVWSYIKSLELEPEDVVLNFSVAVCYINLKEFDKAYEYLLMTKDAGKEFEAFVGFIFYHTEKGEFEKAREYMELAEQKHKGEPMLDYYIANYYENIGDIDKAKEMYISIFRSKPKTIQSSRNIRIIERLDIDVTAMKEQIEKEKEEKYSLLVFEIK